MTAWQWFNAITLAITATFAVVLGVVCILFLPYLAAPRVQAELPSVLAVTATCTFMALAAGVAFLAQRRQLAWRGPAEIALLLALAGGGAVLYRTLV